MIALRFNTDSPRVLCLGAHSDDIEIGCAGTLLEWKQRYPGMQVSWVVFNADGERATEARHSAEALLGQALHHLSLGTFMDGHLPSQLSAAKDFLVQLREQIDPDVILTHRLEDRHQDHRLIGELTWQTWRNHGILEYEIPKYEGDLGQPNLFMPLSAVSAQQKVRHLMQHFGSQRAKTWFNEPVFEGLMRVRGIECRAPSGFAEAFHARKWILG